MAALDDMKDRKKRQTLVDLINNLAAEAAAPPVTPAGPAPTDRKSAVMNEPPTTAPGVIRPGPVKPTSGERSSELTYAEVTYKSLVDLCLH